jgi:hypothetical protein
MNTTNVLLVMCSPASNHVMGTTLLGAEADVALDGCE